MTDPGDEAASATPGTGENGAAGGFFDEDPLEDFLRQERFAGGPREPGSSSGCLGVLLDLLSEALVAFRR